MANKPTSEQARETAELEQRERLMRERTAAAPTDEQHAAADARVDALEASDAADAVELRAAVQVPGEEETDVAQALADYYYAQRKDKAARIIDLGHQLEEGDKALRMLLTVAALRKAVDELALVLEREARHAAVASGEESYDA